MKNKLIKSSALRYSLLGAVVGALITVLDIIPGGHYESFWFFGFASGSLGIWGIIALCIIAQDNPPKETSKRILLFFFMMSLSYYFVEGTRESVISYFTIQALDEETRRLLEEIGGNNWISYNWSAFILWTTASVFCSLYAFLAARFKHKRIIFAILCTPPLLITLTEGIYYFSLLITLKQAFVPAVSDILGFLLCCYLLFFKKKALQAPVQEQN